jgi:hypothetical protein
VQEAVAALCLAWWRLGAPGREALVPQTLPYLLVRALTTGARLGAAAHAGSRGVLRASNLAVRDAAALLPAARPRAGAAPATRPPAERKRGEGRGLIEL